MDSVETSPVTNNENNVTVSKNEVMVTAEQIFCNNVAKKRRSLTKRHSSNLNRSRDLTPFRDSTVVNQNNEKDENRPRTPDRPRRKTKSVERNGISSNSSLKDEPPVIKKKQEQERNSDTRTFLKDLKNRTENFAEIAKNELNVLINKTNESISSTQLSRKSRKKRKEVIERSQSVPYQFTEEQLMACLREKNLLNGVNKSSSFKTLYDGSPKSEISENEMKISYMVSPECQKGIQRRGEIRSGQKTKISNKIIEILDPTTKSVVSTRTMMMEPVGISELFVVMKVFKIVEIREEYQKFKKEMKWEIEKIKLLRNRCFHELFVVILYCGMGGFIFKFTEGTFENFYKCGVKRMRRDFIDLLWLKSHSMREDEWKSLARTRLRVFEEELHAAHEAGMTSYSGQRSWSFLNGILYSITVISTIGYGHIYPTTMTGRALTIVYSLIGIPIFLLALTDFGKLFTRCIKFLWSFVRKLYYTGSCRNSIKQAQLQVISKRAGIMNILAFGRSSVIPEPSNPVTLPTARDLPTTSAVSSFEIDDQFNLPISVAIFILLMYIFIGAFFFGIIEGWNLFKSFYFVFISMSTIGFGDVVPNNPLCTIISIVYLVFGMALTSMCMNLVQEKLSSEFKSVSAKVGSSLGVVAAENGPNKALHPDPAEIIEVHRNYVSKEPDNEVKSQDESNKIVYSNDEKSLGRS